MTIFLAENTRAGGLYNVGTGTSRTWLDLATAIFAALGKPVKIEFVDMPERLKGKYQYFTQAEIAKIRSLGYTDEMTSLEDAVEDYVLNYLVPGGKLEPAP